MLTDNDAMICQDVLNTYVLPQCKSIVKFECTMSYEYFEPTLVIYMKRFSDGHFDDAEYDIFRGYLSMLGIRFVDYVLSCSVICDYNKFV